MEVNHENFWTVLPEILESISSAEYVSIDLEMTGIGHKGHARTGKPSLEEIYAQAKSAAESFQVLQFGLTCFHYDRAVQRYNARTFNCALTPLFINTSSVANLLAKTLDRTVTFSYKALLFLQCHSFSLQDAFAHGVPYLSRQENEQLKERFLQHPNSRATGRLDMNTQDIETREFCASVRNQIGSWLSDTNPPSFLNISNPHEGKLNGLQLRIIHEIVNDEFSGSCRAIPRASNWFVQVLRATKEQEEESWASRLSDRKDAVAKQTGFRVVLEALTGGDFAKDLNMEWLLAGDDAQRSSKIKDMQQRVKEYQVKLKAARPILVGHNQLYDLCFIYRTFFGNLPDTPREFVTKVHGLFPRIVDTKYLAAREDHNMAPDNSLGDLYSSFKHQEEPRIVQDAEYNCRKESSHEAGYDSWATAVLFTKLSWTRSKEDSSGDHILSCDERQAQSTSSRSTSDLVETPNLPMTENHSNLEQTKLDLPRDNLFSELNPFKNPNWRKASSSPASPRPRGAAKGENRAYCPVSSTPYQKGNVGDSPVPNLGLQEGATLISFSPPMGHSKLESQGGGKFEHLTHHSTHRFEGFHTLTERSALTPSEKSYTESNTGPIPSGRHLPNHSEMEVPSRTKMPEMPVLSVAKKLPLPRIKPVEVCSPRKQSSACSSSVSTLDLISELTDKQAEVKVSNRPKIPEWDSPFWRKYGNKLRVGNSETLRLA